MAKAKNAKPAAKPVVAAAQGAIATPAVTLKLQGANESARTADTMAREAAIIANDSDYLDAKPTERLEKILALYMADLTHKAVKESFSAALAILVADKPVRIAASEKSENMATGKLGFKTPEALPPIAPKGEILPEGKGVTELSADDAVAKLTTNVLKQAATAAREALGVNRAKGGGRTAAKESKEARAPFMAEFAAAWNDDALRMQIIHMIEIGGYKVVRVDPKAKPAPETTG
jgi:hypothetical protein